MAETTHIARKTAPELGFGAALPELQQRRNELRWKIVLSNITGQLASVALGVVANFGYDKLLQTERFGRFLDRTSSGHDGPDGWLHKMGRGLMDQEQRADFDRADPTVKRLLSVGMIGRMAVNAVVSIGSGFTIKRYMDRVLDINIPTGKAVAAQTLDTTVQAISWVGMLFLPWQNNIRCGISRGLQKFMGKERAGNLALAIYQQYIPDFLGMFAHIGAMFKAVEDQPDQLQSQLPSSARNHVIADAQMHHAPPERKEPAHRTIARGGPTTPGNRMSEPAAQASPGF